jgi:hypothetical protein
MREEERDLPEPPERKQKPLLSDELAIAMAQGKLDEFLKKRFPNNEHARMLASMMAGLTGMFMPGMGPGPESPSAKAPEGLEEAAQSGDVQGLMDLLAKEHERRTGEKPPINEPRQSEEKTAEEPVMEKEIIDALLKIAEENRVSVDWLTARALKVYIEEYKRTGRL